MHTSGPQIMHESQLGHESSTLTIALTWGLGGRMTRNVEISDVFFLFLPYESKQDK